MHIPVTSWDFFVVVFTLLLIVSFVMNRMSRNFFTYDAVLKKFSIMELEIPANQHELVSLIRGIYKLPAAESARCLRSLRAQLSTDFIFMPLAYGSIAFLCWKVSSKMVWPPAAYIFIGFSFLQCIAWICDIIENIYLFGKIRPDVDVSGKTVHRNYMILEAIKWGASLIPAVCAISAICYFWLSRTVNNHSFRLLLLVVVEIIVFIVLSLIAGKSDKDVEKHFFEHKNDS